MSPIAQCSRYKALLSVRIQTHKKLNKIIKLLKTIEQTSTEQVQRVQAGEIFISHMKNQHLIKGTGSPDGLRYF